MERLARVIPALWSGQERLRFLVVGACNTLFGYCMFAGLYMLLHERLNYLLVALLAHAIAVCQAFTWHRVFVFRSREPWTHEFVRFNLALLIPLSVSLCGLWFCVEVVGMKPLASQAVLTVVAVIVSYLVHRHFTFAAR